MRSLAILALAGALSVAHAQTSPVDSAVKLNRAGQWLAAAQYARRAAGASTSPGERCQLRVEMLTGLDRLGAFSVIPSELATTDSTCAGNAAYASRKPDVDRIRANAVLPPLPKSGVDYSAVDRFNELATILSAGGTPTEGQWRAFYETPGFRFADRPDLRPNMELAFLPSRAARRDSILAKGGGAAFPIRYLRNGFAERARLQRWRDSVNIPAISVKAKERTLAFLPPGTHLPTPLVVFAVFTSDGYSAGTEGVILDLPYATRTDIEGFLAHEFHHSMNAPLSLMQREFTGQPEISLMNALIALRNEGIADLIDKPYPIHHPDSVYQRMYNEAYARTPAILHAVDSLIAMTADDPRLLPAVGQRVQQMLSFSSHPNGAYIAREVYEAFGVDSLMPAIYRPFALFRTYAFAEAKKGNPPPFSATTISVLDEIERKHLVR
jgi:hypothetical protein